MLKDASFGFELFSLTASGALTGGVGSVIAGSGFWDGFRNGAIVSALNHGLHGVDDDRLRTEKHAEAVRAFLKKEGYPAENVDRDITVQKNSVFRRNFARFDNFLDYKGSFTGGHFDSHSRTFDAWLEKTAKMTT